MKTFSNLLLGLAVSLPAWADGSQASELQLIDSYKIRDKSAGFSEPSGLSLSSVQNYYWAVSDAEARLHLLESDGRIKNAFELPELNGTDLEGVAARPDGSVLLIQERDRSLIHLETGDPPELSVFQLRHMNGYEALAPLLSNNPKNKGPEGITVNPATGTVYVAVEGRPRLLITISPDLGTILSVTSLTAEMGFYSPHANDENLDVSGLAWSKSSGRLWMLSDTGRRIFVFDPVNETVKPIDLRYSKKGKSATLKRAEGIAIDEGEGHLLVLTDDSKKSKLYVFLLPEI